LKQDFLRVRQPACRFEKLDGTVIGQDEQADHDQHGQRKSDKNFRSMDKRATLRHLEA
jgi:hypothetical protein